MTAPRRITPRPYTGLMLDHAIAHPRCALWAGMGMGKTVTCLTLIDYLQLVGQVKRVLVLGPKRVARSVWHEEAAKWEHTCHLRVRPAVGDAAHRLRQLQADADVHTLNYENLPWLDEQIQAGHLSWKWDMVIADESTALSSYRIGSAKPTKSGDPKKAPKAAARASALAKYAFGKGVTRWINLTGTPSLKRLQSLWGQTWFLDRGQRLGLTFGTFENRWFGVTHGQSGFAQREPFPHSQTEIQALLSDICLALRPKDWFPISDPNFIRVNVTLPSTARAIYRDMAKHLFAKMKAGNIEAFSAATKSIKLLQLASGAVFLTPDDDDPNPDSSAWEEVHDEKLEALAEIIEETDVPVLVAYHFKPDRARLLKRFKGARAIDTKKDEDDFKAGKISVALVHPDSIGHGVDGFQYVTNVMVFFGHWWRTESRAQLIERIGPTRQYQAGLDRPVFIYDIVATGTADEAVLAAHEGRASMQDALMESVRAACAEA